jgi:hypothetical protein
MNVKEFQNPFEFWLPAGTCCRNQAISNFFFEIWHLICRASFFSKILCMCQDNTFQVKKSKRKTQKIHCSLSAKYLLKLKKVCLSE